MSMCLNMSPDQLAFYTSDAFTNMSQVEKAKRILLEFGLSFSKVNQLLVGLKTNSMAKFVKVVDSSRGVFFPSHADDKRSPMFVSPEVFAVIESHLGQDYYLNFHTKTSVDMVDLEKALLKDLRDRNLSISNIRKASSQNFLGLISFDVNQADNVDRIKENLNTLMDSHAPYKFLSGVLETLEDMEGSQQITYAFAISDVLFEHVENLLKSKGD
jgi:hypothetical protein